MFNIDELRRQIEALIRDNPDMMEDEYLRVDMLDGETDIKGALTALVAEVGYSEAIVEALAQRMQKYTARKARIAHRAEVLRELILKVLQSADLKKIELAEATLSQTKRPPQIIGEPDADELPDELVKIKREPDKAKIRAALLAGVTVPGVVLSNSAPGLTIRAG
jgi:hypothetical protein